MAVFVAFGNELETSPVSEAVVLPVTLTTVFKNELLSPSPPEAVRPSVSVPVTLENELVDRPVLISARDLLTVEPGMTLLSDNELLTLPPPIVLVSGQSLVAVAVIIAIDNDLVDAMVCEPLASSSLVAVTLAVAELREAKADEVSVMKPPLASVTVVWSPSTVLVDRSSPDSTYIAPLVVVAIDVDEERCNELDGVVENVTLLVVATTVSSLAIKVVNLLLAELVTDGRSTLVVGEVVTMGVTSDMTVGLLSELRLVSASLAEIVTGASLTSAVDEAVTMGVSSGVTVEVGSVRAVDVVSSSSSSTVHVRVLYSMLVTISVVIGTTSVNTWASSKSTACSDVELTRVMATSTNADSHMLAGRRDQEEVSNMDERIQRERLRNEQGTENLYPELNLPKRSPTGNVRDCHVTSEHILILSLANERLSQSDEA